MRKFLALFHARNMEFFRDRGTLIWNILFPVILVFGFAFAFSGDEDTLFSVGVIGTGEVPESFAEMPALEFIRYSESGNETRDAVINRLRQHQIDMVIDLESNEYYLNSESTAAPVLRRLFISTEDPARGTIVNDTTSNDTTMAEGNSVHASGFVEREISGEPIRYVDWLVPGVIGMNMMFSCLFGVGFVLVRYRKNGVLKRLKATPVTAFTFVSAQAASRLVIVIVTSAFVFAGTNVFLNFTMNGSYFTLLLITSLAIVCMIAIGLVFAGRLKSEELAGGLMNLVTFPMIILSGVFFSLEGTPEIMQQLSLALPLTHFISGARAIMLEGAGLIEVMPNLLALTGMSMLFLTVSAALFRWE